MSLPSDPGFERALKEFRLQGQPITPLSGGSTNVYRVGDVVLKRIDETSLENNHSPLLAQWICGFTSTAPLRGFRLAEPVATMWGEWLTADGWSASSFLPGQAAETADIPACIKAIDALHRAIRPVPIHPLMDANDTAWGYAHWACWGERPDDVDPRLAALVDALYAIRSPGKLPTAPWQVIHGDLSLNNLLVEPGLPPAILDFSPFFGPPEFALAIFANFAGPRRDDPSVLRYFEHIPNFKQLLIRAAIRMLLVVSHLGGTDHITTERRAAEFILEYARN